MRRRVSLVEKLGLDLENLAISMAGVQGSSAWEEVRSIGKQLVAAGSKPGGGIRKGVEVELVCRSCDRRMDAMEKGRRFTEFQCGVCDKRVGAVWGVSSNRGVEVVEFAETD